MLFKFEVITTTSQTNFNHFFTPNTQVERPSPSSLVLDLHFHLLIHDEEMQDIAWYPKAFVGPEAPILLPCLFTSLK
jgi:hypothetical protein